MSQVHAHTWDSWNDASLSLTHGTPWITKVPSPLSLSWTPDAAPTTPAKQPTSSWNDWQHHETSPVSSCGVCRRSKCQLRSHKAYLSAREARSRYTIHDPGNVNRNPCNAKPKVVDDSVIRTAFTKSYAFVEPSYLSILQPSSFRLDIFHDLPITGGDRPAMHRVIWEFLAHQLYNLCDEHLHPQTTIDHMQRTCLESVMTDPITCLCILATERILRARTVEQIQDEHTITSIKASEKCLEWLRQHLSSRGGEENTSNKVITMCLRLVEAPEATSCWPYHQSLLSSLPDEPAELYQTEHSLNGMKLLTFDSAMAR